MKPDSSLSELRLALLEFKPVWRSAIGISLVIGLLWWTSTVYMLEVYDRERLAEQAAQMGEIIRAGCQEIAARQRLNGPMTSLAENRCVNASRLKCVMASNIDTSTLRPTPVLWRS